jgi:hypothetical protein
MMREEPMVPAPNFIAGILIGIANDFWAIPLSSIGWGIIFCFYIIIAQSERCRQSVKIIKENGRRLILCSPKMTFYVIEYLTAFTTSFVIGLLAFTIKKVLT